MSQQRMDFDETNRQRQEPPFDNYGAGYRDPFMRFSWHAPGSRHCLAVPVSTDLCYSARNL